MKFFAVIIFALFSFQTWSQKSYYVTTIANGDTTYSTEQGQAYWKLYQGVKDAIIESKMPPGRSRTNTKYPITARVYDGYLVTFDVKKNAKESFQIVFHTGDNTVTYVYNDKTVTYRGEHISFILHD